MDADPAWLDEARTAWRAAGLATPPIWVAERAKRLFRTRAERGQPLATGLQRVRATLVFDSRHGAAPAGVRSDFADMGDAPWQFLYRGGDVDVDLLVRPNQDGRTAHVRGQALSLAGRTLGAGTVEATPTPSGNPDMPPSVSSKLEASGEFAFANVARGRYDVLLRLGSRAIELYDVEV